MCLTMCTIMCVYVHIYMPVCVYVYMHTHTHKYIHFLEFRFRQIHCLVGWLSKRPNEFIELIGTSLGLGLLPLPQTLQSPWILRR